jgi:hypothetical protein
LRVERRRWSRTLTERKRKTATMKLSHSSVWFSGSMFFFFHFVSFLFAFLLSWAQIVFSHRRLWVWTLYLRTRVWVFGGRWLSRISNELLAVWNGRRYEFSDARRPATYEPVRHEIRNHRRKSVGRERWCGSSSRVCVCARQILLQL